MAYTKQPKKLMIINILDILQKYTDENHRLSQKNIADILRKEYMMEADRKSVRRNLMDLIDFGYDIEYTETPRTVLNPKTGEYEESSILSDFYIVRDFTDGELRLLIDSLLFSKHIPYGQCRELIEKLEGLSNQYFKSRVKHIRTLPDTAPHNRQLFLNIETVDEAISRGRQISFKYNEFGTDKKMHPRCDKDGTPREYVINPYQIAATNGRYYLICNNDAFDDLSNYRLDRITDIRLLDSPAKPAKEVKGLKNGFDLPRHMAEHIYMFQDGSVRTKFRAKKYLITDIIDWFGTDVSFSDETEDAISVSVTVNAEAMRRWAMQYGLHIEILEPLWLRETVKEDLKKATEKYYE